MWLYSKNKNVPVYENWCPYQNHFLKVLLLLHPTPKKGFDNFYKERTNTINLCFQPRNLTAFL